MTVPDRLLDALTTALGSAGVLTAAASPDDVAGHVVDWRGAHRGSTPAVLRPGSTADVATAVRLCHEAGVALVPQGGNTGLCGGCVPDGSGSQLVLWLGRMRAVRDVDPVGGSATVEAGV
ncbi:FAD-binding oxidoreductase, partial [Nocardioides aquaticus]